MKPYRKTELHDINYKKMINACKKLGAIATQFNVRSYRITKLGKPTIDYYPTSGTAYLHDEKKYIDHVTNIMECMEAKYDGKKIAL